MLESPYLVGFKVFYDTTLLESQMHVGLVNAFKARQYLKEYGRKEYHPLPKFFHDILEEKPLCKYHLHKEL